MMEMFKNKVAVVTGASTGIGREISVALAKEGANVALIARNTRGLAETLRQITEQGGSGRIYTADLREDATKVAREILDDYTDIGIIVNVAGVWHDENSVFYGPQLWETSERQILDVLKVGIVAPMLLTRELLPAMIKNNWGKVLQISGTFSSGAKGWLHYYVSKKALEEFTIGLSQELREHRIQVNTISPADTYTEMYARFYPDESKDTCMDPKDIAKLAIQIMGDDNDFITGQTIVVRNKNA